MKLWTQFFSFFQGILLLPRSLRAHGTSRSLKGRSLQIYWVCIYKTRDFFFIQMIMNKIMTKIVCKQSVMWFFLSLKQGKWDTIYFIFKILQLQVSLPLNKVWNNIIVLQLWQIKQETSSLMAPTRWTALRTSMWQARSSSTGGPPMCMRRGLSTSWRKGPSISPSMFWYCSCGPSSRRQGPLGNLTWLADPAFVLMWATDAMAHTEKAVTVWYIAPGAMVRKVNLVLAYELTLRRLEYLTCTG